MKAIPLPYHCAQNLLTRSPGMSIPKDAWVVVPDDGTLPTLPHLYPEAKAKELASSLTEERRWCMRHGGNQQVKVDKTLTCGCAAEGEHIQR